MDISGKRVLVLGGWGLVGAAVCHRLFADRPAKIIVTSLHENEAREAIEEMEAEAGAIELIPWWGDIFARFDERTRSRGEMLTDPDGRRSIIQDILDDLSKELLDRSALYRLLFDHKPHAIVDCINTATAIAYQDVYRTAWDALKALETDRGVEESVERLIANLSVPQLIRHIQILYAGMLDAGTQMYVKVGTAGSGGMGLNIPYTHSEERPSRVLLSKSSMAGAHTLLLFLAGRTPDGPIIKEVKPTATIAWKEIGSGEVLRHGKPIPLVDCSPENAVSLEGNLNLVENGVAEPTGETLKAPFINTGENGIFSRGEFEAITSLGQMEMITPEEIAEAVVFELKGGNSGHDVVHALDSAVYGPTYRGGYLRNRAVEWLHRLEQESGTDSVAFEMLGPPRLSKLLLEAYLLGRVAGSIRDVIVKNAGELATRLDKIVGEDAELRSRIISIGIPILMADGKRLLRGETIKIPPHKGENQLLISTESIDKWAAAGWVDLRPSNVERWQVRLEYIKKETEKIDRGNTSSRENFPPDYWVDFETMPIGKIVAWIFTVEDKGARMKA
ncbi:MAG: short-chain dehydrogenase [Chlorobi bacterium]|nr:short-chain dehydrogenase [Chlorobiota bacterium]